MDAIGYFDCNCFFGMRSKLYPGSFCKKEDLLEAMKRYGIQKALVYHSLAREYHCITGNEMLMEEIAECPSLYPVWAVMHHHTGEFPEPNVLIKQLKASNIRTVRMFPAVSEQNFRLSAFVCGELLEMLEHHKIPLIIGFDQLSWDEIYELCSRYPNLNIILTDLNYRQDRNLYVYLDKFEHLYIETIGYKVHQGIEEICRRFGARRLIFGSGMPVYSGGAAVCMINYARISDKEKNMIAYENLEGLLGGVEYV